jgi:hypothetical protein
MTRPIIGFFDMPTQVETFREMTEEEYAQYLIYAAGEAIND